MRYVGFSTGALARDDVSAALNMLAGKSLQAVELSALRQWELEPLVHRLDELPLDQFKYKAFHAPSSIDKPFERNALELLDSICSRGWPIIVHPDAMHTPEDWKHFGSLLCIENMDKRKVMGQTAVGLARLFEALPTASFCFDIGHARQVDPTMSEAAAILQLLRDKLLEVHVSEVNAQSKHDPLTFEAVIAFQRVSHLIPPEIPIILESRVDESAIQTEIENAVLALDRRSFFASVIITPVLSAGRQPTVADISGVRISVGLPGAETAFGRFFATWDELRAELLRNKLLPIDEFSAAEADVSVGLQWNSPLILIKYDQLKALNIRDAQCIASKACSPPYPPRET